MKVHLILMLALLSVLIVDSVGETIEVPPSTYDGLSCKIKIPSLVADKKDSITVELRITNVSNQPIRVCTMYGQIRSYYEEVNRWDVHLTPEFWKSDGPSPEILRKSVKTILPKETFSVPFSVYSSDHKPITVGATFSVSAGFANQYGTWGGCIQAKVSGVKIQYKESSEQAVAPNRSLPPTLKSTFPVRGSEDF